MAVDVTTSPSLAVSAPAMLFRGRMAGEFDATQDGFGFLMMMPVEEQLRQQQLVFVLDWFAELRQRMTNAK